MITRIVFLIQQASLGLYLLCAVGLLFSSRTYFSSRHQLRFAEFELERELARRKEAAAITRILAFVEVILAIVAIANVIAPSLQNDPISVQGPAVVVQATNAPFYTSTPGGNGALPDVNGTPGAGGANSIENLMASVTAQFLQQDNTQGKILITSTNAPTPVGTINPDAPKVVGCDTPNAQLEVPANGQIIFDSVTVTGVANIPNFALYKFELSGPSTGNAFTPFGGDKTSPVLQKGVLGQLTLNAFQPGQYKFRLAVFDTTNTLKASCTVNVELRERPPTATLPGAKS